MTVQSVIVCALAAFTAAGITGCASWPRVNTYALPKYGGRFGTPVDTDVAGYVQRAKKRKGPILTGARIVDTGNQGDAILIRLDYGNGTWCNLLIGGTEVDISSLSAGAGIEITSGWIYVHGNFTMTAAGAMDGPALPLWPIVIRKNFAAGAEGTTFIMDCRDPNFTVVSTLKEIPESKSQITLWDYTDPASPKPLDPPNDPSGSLYVVPPNVSQWVAWDGSGTLVPGEYYDRPALPPAYENFIAMVEKLADYYDADIP